MSDFRAAWRRVEELAGETFRTDRDQEFRYRFKRTFIVVEPGDLSIPRTNFEKVFKRDRGDAPADGPAVQGQRYIRAVYDDPRFRASEAAQQQQQ